MRKFIPAAIAAVAGVLVSASPAFAQNAVDYSSLTEAIDTGTLTAALVSVGAVLIVIAVAVMGIRKVIKMVR